MTPPPFVFWFSFLLLQPLQNFSMNSTEYTEVSSLYRRVTCWDTWRGALTLTSMTGKCLPLMSKLRHNFPMSKLAPNNFCDSQTINKYTIITKSLLLESLIQIELLLLCFRLEHSECLSVMILLLDQSFCISLLVQEKSRPVRGYQIPSCHGSETYPLLPSGLQETHSDTGWFVDTGGSELAQRPGYHLTHREFHFVMQIFLSVKIYVMNKSLNVYAECNCYVHFLFLLKVMNMYGELIMESAHHKVILNAMLISVFFSNYAGTTRWVKFILPGFFIYCH